MKMISLQGVLSALASKVRFNVCSFGYIQWCLWLIGLSLGSSVGRANIIYVNGRASLSSPPDGLSWATAFTNVKSAISVAAAGDEVWVAAGNYTNSQTLNITSGVALYGGFLGTETNLNQRNWSANTTMLILKASATGHVIRISGSTSETRIDGLTIAGGSGSGIYGYPASNSVIANNRIVGNQKSGIDCNGALIMITNNVIAGNGPRLPMDFPATGGGGIVISGYPASILNNVIAGNSAEVGGGIYCVYGTVLMAGNTIVGNESTMDGGGIVCGPGTHGIIGNRIFNNVIRQPRGGMVHGGGGLSFYGGTNLTVANNLFMNNAVIGLTSKMNGGGILSDAKSSANIINNTLVGNRADGAGGAIYLEATNQVVMANNLVSGNSTGVTATTNVVFSHNCVYGNGTNDYAGVSDPTGLDGNIARDPRLIFSLDFGTAHLLPDSPCRDAGDSAQVMGDWTDVDGKPRIVGAAVDIGAQESDGVATEFPPRVVRVSSEGDDAKDGSTWTLAKRNVQTAMDTVRLRGGEVWVRAGRYQERIQVDASVNLYGGFAGNETNQTQRDPSQNETILDAQRTGTVVSFIGASTLGGLVDSFTIQNGLADKGGGIFIDRCSPRIAHNVIRQNQAQYGGGIMINGNSSPTMVANRIVSNLVTRVVNPTVSGYSKGGGVYQVLESTATPYSVLINNLIADNKADDPKYTGLGGGICTCGGSFVLINNTIIRNLSLQNGTNNPAMLPSGNTYFENCRATTNHPAGLIDNNIFGWSTSGIYESPLGNDPFVIANNCFYANGANDYYGLRSPVGTNGNLVADPMLVENNGLPRLQSGSPCIDAGDDSVIDPTEPDLAGSRRLLGPHVDIGAIEFVPTVIRLHAPQWMTGAGFRFELVGPEEKEFVVLTSGDLQTWEPVMTNRCGTILITNLPSGQIDRRYFRAVVTH